MFTFGEQTLFSVNRHSGLFKSGQVAHLRLTVIHSTLLDIKLSPLHLINNSGQIFSAQSRYCGNLYQSSNMPVYALNCLKIISFYQ